jgi:hypothetical protein
MAWIWIVMFAALAAAMIISRQRARHPRGAPAAAPGLEEGQLTLTGVTERPLDADKSGQAFCTVSGEIVGPSTPPARVYRRLVLDFGGPWPVVGEQWPVYYKVGKVDSSWQVGRLAPPITPGDALGQYPD